MVSTALSLAILTTLGFIIVYKKLPRKIRRFIEKHSLMADMIALFLTYSLLGGTLTALIAAAMCGLFVSALLYIANNEESFLILYDLKEMMKTKIQEGKKALDEFNERYQETRKQKRNIHVEQAA